MSKKPAKHPPITPAEALKLRRGLASDYPEAIELRQRLNMCLLDPKHKWTDLISVKGCAKPILDVVLAEFCCAGWCITAPHATDDGDLVIMIEPAPPVSGGKD